MDYKKYNLANNLDNANNYRGKSLRSHVYFVCSYSLPRVEGEVTSFLEGFQQGEATMFTISPG